MCDNINTFDDETLINYISQHVLIQQICLTNMVSTCAHIYSYLQLHDIVDRGNVLTVGVLKQQILKQEGVDINMDLLRIVEAAVPDIIHTFQTLDEKKNKNNNTDVKQITCLQLWKKIWKCCISYPPRNKTEKR